MNKEIYETIYELHEAGIEYQLSEEAKKYYSEFSNKITDSMNGQWEELCICTNNCSKDKTNFLRMSCVLHVLLQVYSHLDNDGIQENEEENTENPNESVWRVPEEIEVETLKISEQLIDFFSKQPKAFLTVLDPIKNNSALTKSIGNEEINDENYYAQRVNLFAEWFLESHGKLSELELEKFSGIQTTRVEGRKQIML